MSEDTTETETSTTTETTEEVVAETKVEETAETTAEETVLGTATEEKAEEKVEEKAEEPALPETYELTPPEGYELDAELLTEATPIFKDLNLGNDEAQKLVPLGAKLIEAHEKRKADEFATVKTQWAKDAQADTEIGGKNWKETQSLAAKAMDTFIGPASTKNDKGEDVPNEFRQLLNDTGLGNHPAMIRAFREIGKAVGEDGVFARSQGTVALKKSREETAYPDDVPKT